MDAKRWLFTLLLLAVLLLGPLQGSGSGWQPPTPTAEEAVEARIDAILAQLSVEERVGQLFMVSFVGQDASPEAAISQLISEYKIGGVALLEVNNNIANDLADTPGQVVDLANALQTRASEATGHVEEEGAFFLPLFVAVDHEGDGFPNTRLRSGFTPIPSTMALGATWSLADVEAVGAIVGQELAAVGINMLLGPVVDVLATPHPEGSGDINIRAFGGSPYWVGQLGRAYIRGVHQGGGGRVLTVAKHFPGHGASDRSPDDEVAIVNKSLDELQQSDLIPFFAVTRHAADDPLGVTDAMMPSHIRYRGFQGVVDELTRPISLDQEGMSAFMARAPLQEWRKEGLVVCDSLGVPALKSYYDPTLQSFPAKQIAREALMAGNDVLPLVSFAPADQPNWFTGQRPTIEATITYFQEEYHANHEFRARVDDAVRHILRAKLRLYPHLALEEVLVTGDEPTGQGDEVVARVARSALTILYPRPEDLARRLPTPPRRDEEIVIMGCFENCLAATRISGETIRDTLLDLYGPEGADLIDPQRVQLVNFAELYKLMTGQWNMAEESIQDEAVRLSAHDEAQALIERIQAADWILLVLVNYIPDNYPQSSAARLFLRDPVVRVDDVTTRFDLRDKKIVALALHAPYYLDATEIGKLSAYYAVYTKVQPALEVALRALFQEMTPLGASPVSIEGVGYDLATALSPDPGQELAVTLPPNGQESAAGRVWQVGQEIQVQTGPILDRNGHPVPDGTRVLFRGDYVDLPLSLSPRVVTDTLTGIASALFRPVEAGRLEISASTDDLQAVPVSLLINPLATRKPAAQAGITATAVTPAVTPTATFAPTPADPTPTQTTQPLAATATLASQPVSTDSPHQGSRVAPSGPALAGLIGLGVLLVLSSGGWLWYRRRGPAPATGAVPTGATSDETATVSAELAEVSPALGGRTLGSYRVGRKLGEGGMGQVYQGHHPLLNRTVAIKVLPPALVESEEMRSRFLQEARIAAALRHPNIVQIYDFGEANGLMYMTMEYVDGASLKARLLELRKAEEIMPVDEAVHIAWQIAGALAYAHAHGAIHRDLKPANILLTPEGQAVLVDFGLALLRGAPRYTAPGKVWGSPNYIAPEQLDETPHLDARSDIYSLGVVLYEMVTGQPPFKADAVMEVLWQQANLPPRPPRELAPDLPPALEAVILKALAKRPESRFASAQEMADALAAFR